MAESAVSGPKSWVSSASIDVVKEARNDTSLEMAESRNNISQIKVVSNCQGPKKRGGTTFEVVTGDTPVAKQSTKRKRGWRS